MDGDWRLKTRKKRVEIKDIPAATVHSREKILCLFYGIEYLW